MIAEIIEKPREVSLNHYLVRIGRCPQPAYPGQFISIKTGEGTDPLIRRPFSIYDNKDDVTEIIIQVVGRGTRLISASMPGPVDILGPLGRGFSMDGVKKALLVGGGVGNAPLFYLGNKLKTNGASVTYLYGSRSKDFMYLTGDYEAMAHTFITMTDDGTAGKRGFVTEAAREVLASENFDMVYTCGPTPMMAGMVSITPAHIPIEVSLENYFGCGIGLCVGCTVETTGGFRRACMDGPVMDGKSILWDTLTH